MLMKSLLEADIIPYEPEPKFWFRWTRHWPNGKPKICGIHGRIWLIGFSLLFDGIGNYHNGLRWFIVFRHDPYEWTMGEKVIGVN